VDDRTESLLHITAAGREARGCVGSMLPDDYRTILAAMDGFVRFDDLAAALHHRSNEEILSCLDDLEAIGLVESLPLDWLIDLCMLARYEPQAVGLSA
jgi:hypothetical protein